MKLCTLAILLIGVEFILFSRCKSGTYVYYVKPTEDAECPGQSCETLQYYLNTLHNRYMAIEFQNTTLILLNGTHTIRSILNIRIFWSVINIRGEKNHTVIVKIPNDEEYRLLFILQGSSLYMENLNLLYGLSIGVYDCSSKLLHTSQPQLCDCSPFPNWYDCPSYVYTVMVSSSCLQ